MNVRTEIPSEVVEAYRATLLLRSERGRVGRGRSRPRASTVAVTQGTAAAQGVRPPDGHLEGRPGRVGPAARGHSDRWPGARLRLPRIKSV